MSVTVKAVALVISTLAEVSVQVLPPSPVSVSLLTSMSFVAPAVAAKSVPVTSRTPVAAS